MVSGGKRSLRSREQMRPRAGGGKLKHAPPMRVDDLPVVAQAVGGLAFFEDTLGGGDPSLTVGARIERLWH